MKSLLTKLSTGILIFGALVAAPLCASAATTPLSLLLSHSHSHSNHIGGHMHGTVLSVGAGSFTVSSRKGQTTVTTTVDVDSNTQIQKARIKNATLTDIAVGDMVNVMGTKNDDGSVQAILLRAMTVPPAPIVPPGINNKGGKGPHSHFFIKG